MFLLPALVRYYLKQHLIRKHKYIREGVPRPGKQDLLDAIYVQPQISVCGFGGVDPSHEVRPHPPIPLQVPSVDTFVELNNLFHLRKVNGQPVRTVVTTGIPGIGMSVSVGKFCMDWAGLSANRVGYDENELHYSIVCVFHFTTLHDFLEMYAQNRSLA